MSQATSTQLNSTQLNSTYQGPVLEVAITGANCSIMMLEPMNDVVAFKRGLTSFSSSSLDSI
jgi:hypothetical protein